MLQVIAVIVVLILLGKAFAFLEMIEDFFPGHCRLLRLSLP